MTKGAPNIAPSCNAKILSGRIVTNRDGGGVLVPSDLCTKTGRPVINVLCSKHPPLREPSDIGAATFDQYAELPDPPSIDVTLETIEKVATRLSGAAGPSGVNAVDLQNWLLHYGKESSALREELAEWASWLANKHPAWAAYPALMACRLVALDKHPSVCPSVLGRSSVASLPRQY
jgi:hypothetical protein